MTCNFKGMRRALLAVLALAAIGAQGASVANAHQFKFDGQRSVITGESTGTHVFTTGTFDIVECHTVTLESTVDAGMGQTEVDEITVKPSYGNCTFREQPAAVFVNDCAYVLDSDTSEAGRAPLEIECSAGNQIAIHTTLCTITIGSQTVPNAVTYDNDTGSSFTASITAHGIVVGRSRNTVSQPINGCLIFPIGAVGKYAGTMTNECRTDEGQSQANPTTPTATQDITPTECEATA